MGACKRARGRQGKPVKEICNSTAYDCYGDVSVAAGGGRRLNGNKGGPARNNLTGHITETLVQKLGVGVINDVGKYAASVVEI
jgi:hypothetical protein